MTAKSVTEKRTIVKLDSPKEVAAFAKELKEFIVANKLYTLIGDGDQRKAFSHVEAWQFAGASMGIFFVPVSEEDLSPETGEVKFTIKGRERTNPIFKYKATVEARLLATDQVVGRGVALCSNQEWKKKTFDEYAVLSMAQTRGIGKAGRNTLGWVMKLAGYEPTPAEEIDEDVVYQPVDETAPVDENATPSLEEMRVAVSEHLNGLSVTDKMRLLKTVGKLNDKDLTDQHIKNLWYTIRERANESQT